MIEIFTLLLLFGALLYRTSIGLLEITILSALTSAFFFIYFLSYKRSTVRHCIICTIVTVGAVTMWYHGAYPARIFLATDSDWHRTKC